jgi:hypothetical protein
VPAYHVHGYVPFDPSEPCSDADGVVFTEDQYHAAAHAPHHWSNLVQLHCMTGTVGLMVGLSLSDRNMRRLLDALRATPLPIRHYALLRRPTWVPPSEQELQLIHRRARDYRRTFRGSGSRHVGIKTGDWEATVKEMVRGIDRVDVAFHTRVLKNLGIEPVWFEEYDEIPGLISQIYS